MVGNTSSMSFHKLPFLIRWNKCNNVSFAQDMLFYNDCKKNHIHLFSHAKKQKIMAIKKYIWNRFLLQKFGAETQTKLSQ